VTLTYFVLAIFELVVCGAIFFAIKTICDHRNREWAQPVATDPNPYIAPTDAPPAIQASGALIRQLLDDAEAQSRGRSAQRAALRAREIEQNGRGVPYSDVLSAARYTGYVDKSGGGDGMPVDGAIAVAPAAPKPRRVSEGTRDLDLDDTE
jgi:hypothetical protein